MTSGPDDVLLVRRANADEPAGDGVDTYVVVEVEARVEEPPLARSRLNLDVIDGCPCFGDVVACAIR